MDEFQWGEPSARKGQVPFLRATTSLIASLFCAIASAQEPSGAKSFIAPAIEFGTALGKTGIATYKASEHQGAPPPATVIGNLSRIRDGYIDSRDLNRGGVSLLRGTFSVVYTGIDAGTGGSALALTLPARKVTEYLLGEVQTKADADTAGIMKSRLDGYLQSKGWTYETIKNKSPEELLAFTKEVPGFQETLDGFGDDKDGKAVFQHSMQRLEQGQTENIIGTQIDQQKQLDDLHTIAPALRAFEKDTADKFDDVNSTTQNTQAALVETNENVAGLEARTSANTQQLTVVQDILYSGGSASDKLSLLNAGYHNDSLDKEDIDDLKQSLSAQAQRESLATSVAQVNMYTGELGDIARNLNLPPLVKQSIQVASIVGGAASKALSGDFIGAIAGLTGFFGGGPSMADLIIGHMDERFDRVDKQLGAVLQGEEQLGIAISKVSAQMQTYKQDTDARLEAIDGNIAKVQTNVRSIYFSRGC